MTRCLRQKAGDTLVEVTLAVGIFSMVAVAVVSVVNGSMSKAQAALETTLARESIDIQADAVRFIQAAASVEASSVDENTPYLDLWGAITKDAYSNATAPAADTACDYFLGSEFNSNKAVFAIDVSQLGKKPSDSEKNAWLSKTARHNTTSTNNIFREASTYPRLIYGPAPAGLSAVEGLYVVPIMGDTVNTYDSDAGTLIQKSLYYDFAVHACWNAPGSKTTSHIYTTIRLTNPK